MFSTKVPESFLEDRPKDHGGSQIEATTQKHLGMPQKIAEDLRADDFLNARKSAVFECF